jgi:hypothetical protein
MKSRSFKLILALLGAVLAVFFATSYALNAHESDKPVVVKPKNELIFNWGMGS